MEPSSCDLLPCEVARIVTSNGLNFVVRQRTDLCSAPPAAEGSQVLLESWTPWLTKSLLIRSRRDSAIAIAICPLEEKVDLRAVARLMKWQKARLASPLEVRAFLGPDQGQISPFVDGGSPVLVDAPLARSDRVLVNAGTLDLYLEIAVPDLLSVTHALCARLALPRWRWE
jgi:prolyl-tRNA editing enzyme YbaK/EbsC (Cys-tRNA(Pro) deacylase)